MKRWLILFFGGLFAYFWIIGTMGLPTVHAFYDAAAIRDMSTVWPSLTWHVRDERHFLPAAVLAQHEGPLQFLLLNLYSALVGDLFPLNPRTMQFPNTILAFLGAIAVFRLGKRLHSERFGILCALSLSLMPWLAVTVRFPWVFNLLSVLLELTTLLCYLGFVLEPERRFYRIAAPASLAVYLLTGVDWPSFLFVLALFLLLTRRLGSAIRNPANALPAAVVLVYALWAAALFAYGRYYAPERAHLYQRAILLFPFFKVGTAGELPSLARVLEYAWATFGLTLPCALAGLVAAAQRNGPGGEPSGPDRAVRRRFLLAMGIWMVLALVPLLRTSNAESYGYVAAAAMAVMAACLLIRLRTAVVVLVMAGMVLVQIQVLPIRMVNQDTDDLRVLAAATFLIEQRPDLLGAGKTVLLPGDEAADLGQYARGRKTGLVMPRDFPVELTVHSVGSHEKVLRDFVEAYTTRGEIKADWIVLSCEMLLECETPAGATKAVEFYRKLRADPRIRWIAVFRDQRGRALWIGEVGKAAAPAAPVPGFDVAALARRYEEKYDRYSFLKRDVRYVMHD